MTIWRMHGIKEAGRAADDEDRGGGRERGKAETDGGKEREEGVEKEGRRGGKEGGWGRVNKRELKREREDGRE